VEQIILRIDGSVELRQIAESDAEELTVLIDRNRSHLRQWLPWLDYSRGVQDTARFIGRSIAQAEDSNGYQFGSFATAGLPE